MADALILDAITASFIASAKRDSFNGIVASALLGHQADSQKLRVELSALIREGQVTAVFARLALNMHIKRLPDSPIENQLKLLIDEPLDEFSLYPTASAVEAR